MPDTSKHTKPTLNQLIHRLIALRRQGISITLLAVCPNSDAVLEAAVRVAAEKRAPMLFAATLNQVDRDLGYTGWTPHAFVDRLAQLAQQYACQSPLYPCLDHGGPWLKDLHTQQGLSLDETMGEVKASLAACLDAGYDLLHIDPTIDRQLLPDQSPPIQVVVERTLELIAFAEAHRQQAGLGEISYEVGTEEVHGGLVNETDFTRFLEGLRDGLQVLHLASAWPAFIVAKVGTDLHTTFFDPLTARRLYDLVSPLGSLIKGHYTDWVSNPQEYPATGMGGANVGPEFTAVELEALQHLCFLEAQIPSPPPGMQPSGFLTALQQAVVVSDRWRKWLLPSELGLDFSALQPARQEWLVSTGARYVWTAPPVLAARRRLYANLASALPDPHDYVVERIAEAIRKYVAAFHLENSLEYLLESMHP